LPPVLGTVLGLRAGNYSGRLVIPVQPQPAVSDSFPVIVRNLAPALQPFSPTSSLRVFAVSGPGYDDSQAFWNGQLLPLVQDRSAGGLQVEMAAALTGPGIGAFVLMNSSHRAGVQRESIRMDATCSSIFVPSPPMLARIPADGFQVDRSRKLLYPVIDA